MAVIFRRVTQMKQAMFERDILYPTSRANDIGSVHITVLQPENDGGIPILIEAKTEHNPLDYITEIVNLIQADVFDRIRIDIRKTGILYIKASQDRYCRIRYLDGNRYSSEFVDEL